MSGRIYPPLEALYDADQLEGLMAGQKAPCPDAARLWCSGAKAGASPATCV